MQRHRIASPGPAFLSLAALVVVHFVGSACSSSPPPEAAGTREAASAAPKSSAVQGADIRRPLAPVAEELGPARLEKLLGRNLAPEVSLPESLIAARQMAWRDAAIGERIARWALLFAGRPDNAYCFGPKPGGYVAESLLVQDHRFDCVLLFYRCTELARSGTPRDAVLLALDTRFAGGDPAAVVSPAGGVDYDHPAHLDYSEDFAATGLWGRDVTREVGEAVPDRVGTSRYPAGSRFFIPTARIETARFADGDLLFFVLNEANESARKLREKYGLLVGHQGIVHVDQGEVVLVHAAQSDLAGVYTGNRVLRVPLATYLARVERFKGVMVSRIESDAWPAQASEPDSARAR